MLYLLTNHGTHVLILEPDEIQAIQRGQSLTAPNEAVEVMFTPDAPYFAQLLRRAKENGDLTPQSMAAIHRATLSRAPVEVASPKGTVVELFPKQTQEAADVAPPEQG